MIKGSDGRERHDSSDYDPLPADSEEDKPKIKKTNELTIIKISSEPQDDNDDLNSPTSPTLT